MLALAPCGKCKGKFVVNVLDLNRDYLCGLCDMPSRAGKTRKAKDAAALQDATDAREAAAREDAAGAEGAA